MIMEPDGIEVVETKAEADALAIPPLLIVDSVRDYFDTIGLGKGEISWDRVGDGHSNVTYSIGRGDQTYVLRRGPRPPHPRSTHDMVREARIQQLVRRFDVPVPEILAICEDDSVLGVPFYVMEFLAGEVITDHIPAALDSPDQRRGTALAAVDALVSLHRVDVTKGPLSRLGRPNGYLARQVALFASLWGQNTTRTIPEVAILADWLAENLPVSQGASVVHGDYRLGNLMFDSTSPARVSALLDWEMATLGDPLADLGYLAATYATEGAVPTPMELTPVTRLPGYPSREELIDRYREQFHLDVGALPWYEALAVWKAAIFCEAMYTRWLKGERPGDDFAPTLEAGVPALLDAAREFAGIAAV